MSEVPPHSFRTKTGTCVVTPDQIILSREGISGAAAKHIHGNSILPSLVISGFLGVLAVGLSVWMLANDDYASGGFFVILGLFLLWRVVSSRNNSAAPIIERATIESVEARSPHPPLTRGYFVVRFLENGKERKRLIMLPGILFGGNSEYQRALLVMDEAGLLVRRPRA